MPYGVYLSAFGRIGSKPPPRTKSVNNLANVDTPGFKTERLTISPGPGFQLIQQGLPSHPVSAGADDVGGGVTIQPEQTN